MVGERTASVSNKAYTESLTVGLKDEQPLRWLEDPLIKPQRSQEPTDLFLAPCAHI